jgi:hypothetical protein
MGHGLMSLQKTIIFSSLIKEVMFAQGLTKKVIKAI